MQHETLAMQKDADPFRVSMDHRICHSNLFHMPLVALLSEVLVDGEIVEVVCTFKVFDSSSKGVELCGTDPPGSFAL